MWAAAESQPDMVKELIRSGADLNARSQVNEWSREVSAEPRIQWRPAGGLTALLYACRQGCLACVKHLVEGGADVNLGDPKGVTPLIMATTNLNFDIAAYLLRERREPEQVGLLGTHGAVRSRGPEHLAAWRLARPPVH